MPMINGVAFAVDLFSTLRTGQRDPVVCFVGALRSELQHMFELMSGTVEARLFRFELCGHEFTGPGVINDFRKA